MNEEDIQQVPPTTPNLHTDVARKLADLLPEVVADGKIDVAALQAVLGYDATTGTERFGLFWPGKTQAIRAAQTPTTATLAPDRENSLNWDTTGNVIIEGDNLEVLKVLQKHYYGKIKMIYIDPPYNTGSDFVYPDDYADPIGTYLEKTGQIGRGGGRLSTNPETGGRFHSNWLNMMYPRLKLARNLLTDDGCLIVSIGDEEIDHARAVLSETFGEANYVGTLAVIRAEGGGLAKHLIRGHDYALVFARNIGTFQPLLRPKDIRGSRVVIDGEEYWIEEDWLRKEFGKYGTCLYEEIEKYHGAKKLAEIDEGLAAGKYVLKKKAEGHIVGRYRKVSEDGSKFYSVIKHLNKDGVHDLAQLGSDLSASFDFPKPVSLVKSFIRGATMKSSSNADIILDFFAGSGTTAHAVMALNAEDGGNRRCISVQLPEPTDEKSEARKAGYENIAEITRERIRRAGAKILEEESAKLDGRAEGLDVGFRAYRLVDTNFAKWRADSSLSEEELADLFAGMGESADDDARPEALLTEVLLKLGFSLTEQVERVDVAGLEAFSVAGGLVVAYLNEHVKPTLEQLRAMVALEPGRLVVLEDAFQGDDVLKTNLVQECRSRGVDLWTA
ncbi:MAG: site-specific DNA-methyltransferase [Schaalia turicensis]